MVRGRVSCVLRLSSSAHHVDDEEHDDPYRVDEVPVEGEDFGARGACVPFTCPPSASTSATVMSTSPTITCEACRPTSE